jgi:signal transduction histidine kinase
LSETSPLKINIDTNIEVRFDKEIEVTLYRVIIEFINNTVKYAKAKNISITLMQAGNQISIRYADDGVGFECEETIKSGKGIGLFNIQNRIEVLGGSFSINSQPGKGMMAKVLVNI